MARPDPSVKDGKIGVSRPRFGGRMGWSLPCWVGSEVGWAVGSGVGLLRCVLVSLGG